MRAPFALLALVGCRSTPPPPAAPLTNRPVGAPTEVREQPSADLATEVKVSREPSPPPVAPDLTGVWQSACLPGATAGTSTRLSFTVAGPDLTVDVDAFTDPACATHEAVLRTHGPFALGADLGGAWEATFTFAQRTLIVDDAAAARRYARLCQIPKGKLRPGQPADLLAVGCPGLAVHPVARCPGDHDRVAVVGDELRFGVRPPTNELCTPAQRPTRLETRLAIQPMIQPTGIPECDAYLRTMARMARCGALPASSREALRNALAASAGALSGTTPATTAGTTPVAAQMATACLQADQATSQSLASIPCP